MQKTIVAALAGLPFGATAALAQDATAAAEQVKTIDQTVNEIFATVTGPFVNLIFAPLPGTAFPWIVLWLVVAASLFTLYFGFIQIRGFGHAISLVKGDYSDPRDAGEVSHFQALTSAVSGTVGLGNIAGVAVAVEHRRRRRDVLDGAGRPARHVDQVRRVHAGREVPAGEGRRHRVRRPDVLPEPRHSARTIPG